MRDIKSLQPKEQILISTGKELKKFCKLIDFRNLIMQAPCFYTQNEHGRGFSSDDNKLKTSNVADFLPKKKKKVTMEWVEKYVAKALYAKQTQEAVERALQPSKEQISDLVTTDPADLDVKGAEVVSGGLQEGKWYKNDAGALFVFNGAHDDEGYPCGYGIDITGMWHNEDNTDGWGIKNLIKATYEEVKETLIKEAKKRGFKVGVKYKCAFNGLTETVKRDFTYFPDTDNLTDGCGGAVYSRGKWATIIESEKEIDWGVKQLVKSKSSNLVVAYTGQHNDYEFSGFVVRDTEKKVFGTGLSSLTWVKSEFEPYTIPNEN